MAVVSIGDKWDSHAGELNMGRPGPDYWKLRTLTKELNDYLNEIKWFENTEESRGGPSARLDVFGMLFLSGQYTDREEKLLRQFGYKRIGGDYGIVANYENFDSILRMFAGLEHPWSGTIRIREERNTRPYLHFSVNKEEELVYENSFSSLGDEQVSAKIGELFKLHLRKEFPFGARKPA